MTKDEQVGLFARVRGGLSASERLRSGSNGPEEDEILRRLAEDGREARDTLFKHHQRLIWMLIRHRERKAAGSLRALPEDMFQEGSFGLMRAIEKFDPDRGVAFSTYACRWILQAMIRAHKQGGLIRIPIYAHDKHAAMVRAGDGPVEDLPSVEVLLDRFVNQGDDETARLGDLVEDAEATYQQEVRMEVAVLLSKMSSDGAYCYRRHYLDGISVSDLAVEYGCCRHTMTTDMRRYASDLVVGQVPKKTHKSRASRR